MKSRSATFAMLTTLSIVLSATGVRAAPFAYVPNRDTNVLSVIDLATNTVATNVPIGHGSEGVAVNAQGTRAYVSNKLDDTVSVVDASSNTVVATIPVGSNPLGIAVDTPGERVYVANQRSDSMSVIDAATNSVIATVPVGKLPFGVAVNPAGSRVYVTNPGSKTMSVIDTASLQVIASVPVGTLPRGVAVTPSGRRVYVAHVADFFTYDARAAVVDAATNLLVADIPLEGHEPFSVAVHPTRPLVYVPGGTISVIDTTTNSVVSPFRVGTNQGIALDASGTRLYVVEPQPHFVTVVDTNTSVALARVNVGGVPIAIGKFIATGIFCGDGFVAGDEECDAGELNGNAASCCSSGCTTRANGASCDDESFCNGSDSCVDADCSEHAGDPCSGGGQCNDRCNEVADNCADPTGTICDTGLGIACSEPDVCDGAGTCASGGRGDPDDDAVCAIDDNCVDDFNPVQKDINLNGLGDACDSPDAALNLSTAVIKSNTGPAARPNGSIKLVGDFLTRPAPPRDDVFDALNGIRVRVEDALGLDFMIAPSFTAPECRLPTARGVIRCRSSDRRFDATIMPTVPGSPVFLFKFNLRRIPMPAASYGPVTVTITHGDGVDRIGTLSSCVATSRGVTCRLV